ncbi:MAG TPA: hypothetical protein DCX95_00340 [Elusimicrobia bacterium]|nr:hypothetical protein [Elusimicrobiota bacterium]
MLTGSMDYIIGLITGYADFDKREFLSAVHWVFVLFLVFIIVNFIIFFLFYKRQILSGKLLLLCIISTFLFLTMEYGALFSLKYFYPTWEDFIKVSGKKLSSLIFIVMFTGYVSISTFIHKSMAKKKLILIIAITILTFITLYVTEQIYYKFAPNVGL